MKKSSWLYLSLLLIPIVLIDVVSKFYVHNFFPPHVGPNIYLFHNFLGIDLVLEHVRNKGAAWGMFASYQTFLMGLRMAVILAMTIYLIFFNKNSLKKTPLALVVTGALCNVVDYFIYGHVIDMIHFTFWGWSFPVFNVADTAITFGVAWLFYQTLFLKPGKNNVPSCH